VITKIAPFGAFARIEDGIEGLIHLSELTPGMDPKANLHEGQQLQLRILRIEADRRRLGLSLRQADEMDTKEVPAEAGTKNHAGDVDAMSLEEAPAQTEASPAEGEKEAGSPRREGKSERRERAGEKPLLSNLPSSEVGETTAMAEAFRAAARQRSKEETEASEE
jgi:small subunit ribosomal protein S1